MFSDRAALTDIVGQRGGIVPMGAGAATIYFEVKVGSDFSNLLRGAKRAADTLDGIDPKANIASVLVLDRDAYNALSKDQQKQLLAAAGGAYIQLQKNLNRDAAQLTAKARREACDTANKCK